MRILTVSNLYPSSARPVHGIFVQERMTRFAARQQAELRVIAPVPWFPFTRGFGEYSRIARTPVSETRKGIPVLYPRIPTVPKIGMTLAPYLWRQRLTPLIRRVKREWDFDILDAHYIYPDCVALVPIARELGVPIVVSARGTDVHLIGDFEGPRERIREACSAASVVVAVSKALSDHLVKIGVPAERIRVVPNGADLDAFAPRPGTPLTPIAGGRVLLGIGRLVPQKGFHLAIQAMATLLPKYPDLTLVLAGRGADRENLENLAAACGVHDRVKFVGEVVHDKIPELLWASHRLVLPSFREGYPNVVVEAIASGTPVVATAIGGIPEIVDDEVGDIAAQPDAESFTRALDRSLSREFDKAIFDRRRATLHWDHSLDLLSQAFDAAVKYGPPR